MNMIKNWTNDELMFIRNFWREKSDKWMANKLGVPIHIYKYRRQRLKLFKPWTIRKGRRTSWTYAQEVFLCTYYPTHSAKDIARHLNRSIDAIRHKAKRMNLKKNFNPGRRGFRPIDNYYNNPQKNKIK